MFLSLRFASRAEMIHRNGSIFGFPPSVDDRQRIFSHPAKRHDTLLSVVKAPIYPLDRVTG